MMNREFLESLYKRRDFAARHHAELTGRDTFCAEQCQTCNRGINSDEHAHRAAEHEAAYALNELSGLLDMYWATHNGVDR